MTLAKTDPLYDALRPCRAWLHYADWHDVETGRFEAVAERLHRRARWWLWLSAVLTAGVALFSLYHVWQFVRVGGGGNLLLAVSQAVFLVIFVPMDIRLYRALVAAQARLRERAAVP